MSKNSVVVSLTCRKIEIAGQFLLEFCSVEFSRSSKILGALINDW